MSLSILVQGAAAVAKSPEAIEQTKLLYLGLGYAAVWVAVAGYLLSINRRQKRLEERMEKLKADEKKPEN